MFLLGSGYGCNNGSSSSMVSCWVILLGIALFLWNSVSKEKPVFLLGDCFSCWVAKSALLGDFEKYQLKKK